MSTVEDGWGFPFVIFHFEDGVARRNDKWKMTNDKWKTVFLLTVVGEWAYLVLLVWAVFRVRRVRRLRRPRR